MDEATGIARLKDAFARSSVVAAGIDLQKFFYSKPVHSAFENSARLADELRPTTPIIWVRQTHIAQSELHIVEARHGDRRRIKRYNEYNDLLKPEIAHGGTDTVIVSGVFAAACVQAFVSTSVARHGLQPVVAVDAIDSNSIVDQYYPGTGYSMAERKAVIRDFYGAHVTVLSVDEIMACRP